MLEHGAVEPIVARLAPTAVLWHNSDKIEMDAALGVVAITGLHALVDDVRVDIVDRSASTDRVLLQYVLRGTVKTTSAPFEAHQCVVIQVADGLITRMDEYADPTMLEQLGVA